jgi:hypothetical protein
LSELRSVCETAATNRFVVLEMDSNQDVPLSSTSTSSAHASALGFSASTSTSARASSLGFSAFDESSLHLPDLPESDFGYYGGRGVSQIPPDAVAPPATFGPEDRQVHRSVPEVMTSFHAGGLSAIAQRPPSFGVPSLVNQGARYLPTGLQHPGGADRSLVFRVSDKLSGGAPIAKDLSSGSDDGVCMSDVPRQPMFLEANTHAFLSSKSASIDKVCGLVDEILRKGHSDFVFKPRKCKWKAYRNEGHVSVDFRVRVFLSNDDDFAVEFQKRKVLILILSISNLS